METIHWKNEWPELPRTPTKDRKRSEIHNAAFADSTFSKSYLGDNVKHRLHDTVNIVPLDDIPGGWTKVDTHSVRSRFEASINAPNYTTFFNKPSMRWVEQPAKNDDEKEKLKSLVSLESPHNAIHLVVGSFYPPPPNLIEKQKRHGQTAGPLEILGPLPGDEPYPGTAIGEYAPAGFKQGQRLNGESKLIPFTKDGGDYFTLNDVTDIGGAALGYSYGPGSLDVYERAEPKSHSLMAATSSYQGVKKITGLSCANFGESFVFNI
ncbi:hypothetical protein B0H67DRAFT_640812 [Lasiosphaeris hirsuta]|uniref:Uncharacterized protein n=1 Tax=Lasiosphaeris hirsuta TaxID=260670 RepID=A0AA40AYA7_9PEZI|nr:hypothetical protein B0H67DRAFT_640812 [Lasiosphaeris hirsuta]